MRGLSTRIILALTALLAALPALAHVSERGLVLLLPTQIYIRSGVIAVALTVALLFLIPPSAFKTLFRERRRFKAPNLPVSTLTSLFSMLLFFGAIYAGFNGSRDPLANPLPLLIWTIWWIMVPVLSAFLGNIWHFINPWMGLYRLTRLKPIINATAGYPIAALTLLIFSLFVVTHIAPDDPERLATIALSYWAFTAAMLVLFGENWLQKAEPFTVYFKHLAKLSPIWSDTTLKTGFPGVRLAQANPPLTLAILIIIALGAGSFDGLNETFWWLAQIGINPLEFPGRSAVALQNGLGLIGGITLLGTTVALCTWLGLKLVGEEARFKSLFPRLSLSLIPIALGYHIAHYLTSFMVGIQYALKSATDPMSTGQDLLGLGQFYVTTSFFNVPSTVEAIWLTQATAIVIGHILAVLIAHAIALDALKNHRNATVSQLPVAAFMVAYTFFGLWILAQPTGA